MMAFGIRVVTDDSGISQYICEQRSTALPLTDWSTREDARRQAQARVDEILSTPMEINDCELFRCGLIKLPDDEYWFTAQAHHLAIDGVGFANLVRQLVARYNDDDAQPQIGLWQGVSNKDQLYLIGKRYHADQVYWQKMLADMPDNPLPAHYIGEFADKPLIPSASYSKTMSWQWKRELQTFAESLDVGMTQVLMALLSHYFSLAYGQPQLTLGLPLHNRSNAAQKSMIGMFVGISPLIVDVDQDATFAGLARSIQALQKQNFRHQRFPIGHMINQLPAQLARDRLFDISFNYQQIADIPNVEGHPCDVVSVSHRHETIPLDLKIKDYGDGQVIKLQFDYNLAFFNGSEMAQLSDRLLFMMEKVKGQANRPLRELAIMPQSELAQLHQWSNADLVQPASEQCIHHLFEATAERVPNDVAITASGQSLRYGALEQKANRFARYLVEKGIKPDDRVALCVERTVAMLPAILGVLKAGGAYVPMDPAAPQARLQFMIEDSGARLLLTQSSLVDKIAMPGIETLFIDNDDSLTQWDSSPVTNVAVKPDNLAYVIYTSGSTGQPKGVMATHKNACTLAAQLVDWPVSNRQKCWGWNANVVFDASIHGLLSLVTGQCVALLPADAKLEPRRLVQLVHEQNIGVLDCTPSMVELWLNAGVGEQLPNLVIGGEAISRQLWKRLVQWQQAGPNRIAVNIYGPTECCVNITCHPISGVQPTIGEPLPHVKTYLVDEQGRLAPKGVVGELLIGGACVTRGYLNRPELSAEKFIHNPFNDDPSDRLYKTGDLVRYLDNGNLAFIGRCDDQVKIRGYRVELGEIQNQLNRCDGVRESVVVVNEQRQTRLVAYVVGAVEHLQSQLSRTLPEYMVPDVFIPIERFPLTRNGKVDKKRLPSPDQFIENNRYRAPENAQQQALAAIWAEVLKLDSQAISIEGNFFELGGHSLLAVSLATRIADQFHRTFTIADAFRVPTIVEQALYLEQAPRSQVQPKVVAFDRQSADVLPASFAQQRMYFINSQDKTGNRYNMPGAWRFEGTFSPDIAEQALTAVIEHHETLRTNFADVDGQTVQVIRSVDGFALNRIDLRDYSEAEQQQKLADLLDDDAETPFCLEQDMMLRSSVVSLSDGQGVLLINIHHVAADGWSVNLLIKAFMTCYQAICAQVPPGLPALPVSYVDFAASQRRWVDQGLFEAQLDYWQTQLEGIPDVHSLPLARPRPNTLTTQGARIITQENRPLLTGLEQLAQVNNTSLFMVIHAVFFAATQSLFRQ